jgi:hypothetical protein
VLFHAGLVQRRREASAVIYWLSASDVAEWCRYLGTRHLHRPGAGDRMDSSRGTDEKRSSQRTSH